MRLNFYNLNSQGTQKFISDVRDINFLTFEIDPQNINFTGDLKQIQSCQLDIHNSISPGIQKSPFHSSGVRTEEIVKYSKYRVFSKLNQDRVS